MSNIFNLDSNTNFSEKINIDDLYEKKRQYDLNKLDLFNKILNRIHVRIKLTSRQKLDEQFCWYTVPEIIIGVPKYDQASCIAYLIDKLKTNGFNVKYIIPNTLFISWNHWVPHYVRSEIKKKTGIQIDEYGKEINNNNTNKNNDNNNISSHNNLFINLTNNNTNNNTNSTNNNTNNNTNNTNKVYRPIQSYKPTGKLI